MAKKLSTTSKGVAVYPHLLKPDTKYKDTGVYHIKVKYEKDSEYAIELAHLIDAAMKESLKLVREALVKTKGEKKAKMIELADKPYSVDDEDGSYTFSFKMNAEGKSRKTGERFTQKPVVYNAAGTPVEGMKVGGGSVVRVSFELKQFPADPADATPKVGAGATLRLHAVQVIKLVEFGANAEYHGFKDESEDEDATVTPAAMTAEDDDEPKTPATKGKKAPAVVDEDDEF